MCWLLVCVCLISSGCVRRRITVRTNAPGAQVYIDRKPIGSSPASTSVTYYGTRLVEVVADGYETEKVLHRFNPPWYQIPPIDFFAETLWPWELRDEQTLDISLRPRQLPNREELIARAESLRAQSAQGVATPLVIPAGGSSDNGLTENPGLGITDQGGVVPSPGVLPGQSFPIQNLPNPYGGPSTGVSSGVGPGFAPPPGQQSGAGGIMSPSVPPVRDYRPPIGGN